MMRSLSVTSLNLALVTMVAVLSIANFLTIPDVTSLDSRLTVVETRTVPSEEAWRRADMAEWCVEFARLNTGIRCPEPRAVKGH